MSFKNHIASFQSLLLSKEYSALQVHPYCKRYLQYLCDHSSYFLSIYAEVLEKVKSHSEKDWKQLCLVDYGAGNGLLGIFAKYCGVGKVFINDISSEFIDAAVYLSEVLGVQIDGFIEGDISNVSSYSNQHKIDAIIGTDVIEHIYNLDAFFFSVKEINPEMITVFTTASNPDNWFKLRKIRKLQLKDEFEGGNPEDSILFGSDSHESFLEMRKKIISENAPHLSNDEVLKLAKLTRGSNLNDIRKAILNYVHESSLPKEITHPTNTCNPISGSWTERILTIKEYQQMYNQNGFQIHLYNGFYDTDKNGVKNIINSIMNISIRIFGRATAPYITLVGYRK
ncbi:MAG: class I SAM-dependent methyltransferase [Ferruginibacter sp.]|nr:class I SAM-dependent methyltransferase [Ferruginibacter sp.]